METRDPKKYVPKERGEMVEKMFPTQWLFWRCPETGCKVVLRATVEKFVLQGASNHQAKHQRDRAKEIEMTRRRAELEKQTVIPNRV